MEIGMKWFGMAVCLTLFGCLDLIPEPQPVEKPPDPGGSRAAATYTELTDDDYTPTSPIHNDHFLPMGVSAPAHVAFAGRLQVAEQRLSLSRSSGDKQERFPGFQVSFFSHQGYLVPQQRDILQPKGHSFWTLLLSPGRVWSEPGDQGMSRAAFPFVLAEPYHNAAHNGIATFLYDEKSVSNLRLQIVQESAPWDIFDAWSQLAMSFRPVSENFSEARARFDEELASHLILASWDDLENLAGSPLNAFDADLESDTISYMGVVVDRTLYLPPFETRYGPFPFPRYMRGGAFSVTKSMGAALALFRLSHKYGPGVFDLYIKDYLDVTASHDGWDQVTFRDCLNMATGIGDITPNRAEVNTLADETGGRMGQWNYALSLQGKLNLSFAYNNYPWGRDQVVRYNSTHTFVLSAAMDAYLKSKEGGDARIWDMVTQEVLAPIGIRNVPIMHTREEGGRSGVPYFAMGLYPRPEDLAKVCMFLQNGGKWEGAQLIDPEAVKAALFRDGGRRLPTGTRNDNGDPHLYQLSFWSEPIQAGTDCFHQVPYMMGYGGNMVVLAPNGISGFRFSDTHNYDVLGMIRDMERIRPFCQ